MKRLTRIVFLVTAAVAVLFVGCRKTGREQVLEHPFTEQELVKHHVEESFSAFVVAMDLDSTILKDPVKYINDHSTISTDLGDRGAVIYRLINNNLVVLEARFYLLSVPARMEASLYGGLEVRGTVSPTFSLSWDKWEENWDLKVYDNGTAVANLGVEPYSYTEAGQTFNLPQPVLRYPDGTSYALSSLLIIEPLVDYLIENVVSTE